MQFALATLSFFLAVASSSTSAVCTFDGDAIISITAPPPGIAFSNTGGGGNVNCAGWTYQSPCQARAISGCAEVACSNLYKCQQTRILAAGASTEVFCTLAACRFVLIGTSSEFVDSVACEGYQACQNAAVIYTKALDCIGSESCQGAGGGRPDLVVTEDTVCVGPGACSSMTLTATNSLMCTTPDACGPDCFFDDGTGNGTRPCETWAAPTPSPSPRPTVRPTRAPTLRPTQVRTLRPTPAPVLGSVPAPTPPSVRPPVPTPTPRPTLQPARAPTMRPKPAPTPTSPTIPTTLSPTLQPTPVLTAAGSSPTFNNKVYVPIIVICGLLGVGAVIFFVKPWHHFQAQNNADYENPPPFAPHSSAPLEDKAL